MIGARDLELIDEYSADGFGWARFSRDHTQRFRLGRAISDRARQRVAHEISVRGDRYGGHTTTERYWPRWLTDDELIRVVFVMLNPSTADAFEPDRTIGRCVKFALLWGADIVEAVNLFSLVSPYPTDLYHGARNVADIGANHTNDVQIVEACTQPRTRVIAAWGRHGRLNDRDVAVRELLLREHVMLEALGTTQEGYPLHPLARGKHFIPYERKPRLWP